LTEPLESEASSAERGSVGYEVRLATFEGPLDLLLHLIQQHELDIMDIPIGFVTEKYVEYILLMQELNIDIASEYLVMAATLAHMKSKLMLPTPPSDQEDEEGEAEDPRAELVRRLLEYQKYKLAAATIADRSILGRDVFVRGAPGPAVEGTPPLAPVSMFKLLESFQSVLDRAKKTLDHEIEFERISITDRINQLSDVLRRKRRMAFEELFEGDTTRPELIVTFLALLEMTRLRMTRLFQQAPLDPIFVELSVPDDETEPENVSARVEPDAPVGAAEPAVRLPDEPQ
jgi:segregation and condensation protein A